MVTAMPAFRPSSPPSLRNGLKWREGRPRWEPSPAARKLGIAGKDLRTSDGGWMDRGAAIGAADARALWASMIREARHPGPPGDDARADLRAVLEALPRPKDDHAAHLRTLVADLIAMGRQILAEFDVAAGVAGEGGPRSVQAVVEGYLADPKVEIADSTREAYTTQGKRLGRKFGARPVGQLSRLDLINWYEDELLPTLSVPNANQCMGATMAFLAWAERNGWIAETPAVRLGLKTAQGRKVFWTFPDEDQFVAFADGNGFEDIADGIVTGLWTGARIGDVCAADLPDLDRSTWRFTPEKTRRHHLEALPGIMPQVKARIERRKAQLLTALDRGRQPFLVNPQTGQRHDAGSFGERYRTARALAVAADAVPEGFSHKNVQDTRDTCITRLFLADIPIDRMWTWTGHSQQGIEKILKAHYIVLREEGSVALMAKLQTWFDKHQVQV